MMSIEIFRSSGTVDSGRNPANQLRSVVYSTICKVLYILGVCLCETGCYMLFLNMLE